jgi:hypothetical protein
MVRVAVFDTPFNKPTITAVRPIVVGNVVIVAV